MPDPMQSMMPQLPPSLPPSKPIPVKMKKPEREKYGKDLLEKIERSRKGMQRLLGKIKDWRNFYESDLPAKSFPWEDCSNVNVPVTQWHVDTYQAHIKDVVVGVRPFTMLRPAEPADKKVAMQVENLLQNVEEGLMNLPVVLTDIIANSLIEGTSIPKLVWREEYRTVKEIQASIDPITGMPSASLVSRDDPKYVGPRLEFVDIRNFVIYPLTAPTVDDAVLVGDRFRLTSDQVKRRVKDGYFDREYTEPLLERPDKEQSTIQDIGDIEDNVHEGIDRVDVDFHYFWEVITGYDVDGDGLEEDCLVTLEAETGVIVRMVEYPYWHGKRCYIRFAPFPRPNRFFGRSIPQIVEGMQREINTIHNQRTDATLLALCKAFKQLDSSDLKSDAVKLSPGAVFRVASMDEIEEFDIAPVIPGLDIEQISRDYAERADGINDVSLGRETQGDKTAREVAIVSSEGGIRFGDVIQNIQCALVEIAEQVIGLCYQFMEDQDIEKYAGTQTNVFETTNVPGTEQVAQEGISRDALRKRFDYVPHGNTSTSNKVQQREEAKFLYDALQGNPLIAQNPLRIHRMTRDLLVAFDRDDYESYIGTEEELQQQMQQMAQMQATQQQVQEELVNAARGQGGTGGGMGGGQAMLAGGSGMPGTPM